jgi:hypothetical protein
MARRTLVLDQPVESVEVTKKKSRKGIYIGIAILAIVPVVGSTFASLININSTGPIEFGQGYKVVAACDSSIKLTPAASFLGSATTAQWSLATVKLELDTTTEGCAGKTVTVIPRDVNGSIIKDSSVDGGVDSIYAVNIAADGSSASCASSSICSADLTDGVITITPSASPSTDNIVMFTVESSETPS